MNIFITGANRGIGAGFVRHYLSEGDHVWACHRGDSGELSCINSASLHPIHWNVATDSEPRGELPERIDLLINNAGIYGPGKDGQSLENVTPEAMLEVKHLKQRLIMAKGVIANISSKMGSSGDNSSGGAYAYRAAKAGLVIISRSMAIDLADEGVQVVTLHPGWGDDRHDKSYRID